MKIHEYQAKEVLRKFGIRTPKGGPAFSWLVFVGYASIPVAVLTGILK